MTGDTLFVGGCGRFFEGTGEDMHAALSYLATLPDNTITYVGHEYTADNLAFAKKIEPGHEGFTRLEQLVKSNDITTGKSTIGDEKDWNVFMRLNADGVRSDPRRPLPGLAPFNLVLLFRGATGSSASEPEGKVMSALRQLKNNFG